MISCEQCLELLDDYRRDGLSPEETEQVRRHLLECPECGEELNFRNGLALQLRASLPEDKAPAWLSPAVSQALKTAAKSPSGTSNKPVLLPWMLSAAAVFVIGSLAFMQSSGWRMDSGDRNVAMEVSKGKNPGTYYDSTSGTASSGDVFQLPELSTGKEPVLMSESIVEEPPSSPLVASASSVPASAVLRSEASPGVLLAPSPSTGSAKSDVAVNTVMPEQKMAVQQDKSADAKSAGELAFSRTRALAGRQSAAVPARASRIESYKADDSKDLSEASSHVSSPEVETDLRIKMEVSRAVTAYRAIGRELREGEAGRTDTATSLTLFQTTATLQATTDTRTSSPL